MFLLSLLFSLFYLRGGKEKFEKGIFSSKIFFLEIILWFELNYQTIDGNDMEVEQIMFESIFNDKFKFINSKTDQNRRRRHQLFYGSEQQFESLSQSKFFFFLCLFFLNTRICIFFFSLCLVCPSRFLSSFFLFWDLLLCFPPLFFLFLCFFLTENEGKATAHDTNLFIDILIDDLTDGKHNFNPIFYPIYPSFQKFLSVFQNVSNEALPKKHCVVSCKQMKRKKEE